MDRGAYIVGRLLQMVPVLTVLAVLVFLMIRLIPGDPAVTLLGVEATPAKVAALREHLGLDQPLWVQFGLYVTNLAHGDLGSSFIVRVPVLQLIQERLPLTLFLVAYAMTLAVIITFPLAVLAALHRDSFLDQCVRGFTVAMMSTPGFWVGIILLIVLGVKLSLFPVGGAGKAWGDRFYYLFLPALTLALGVSAVLIRNLRDAILSTLNAEHVVFARAKGLNARLVLVKHVLRNALISTITLFGLYIGFLVGGSVIVESVFALPGMGSMMISAILGRDYQIVQGFTLVYAVLVSIVYLLTDVTYSFVDPRITL
jgi:peptide/nickel transport system permease protein